MELQDRLEALRSEGIEPYAISYDSVETLSGFARKHNITYSLLADTDSGVIRKFGIFNPQVPDGHRWFGIPYPGTYFVDPDGVVTGKSFYADHGVRDSVSRMVETVYQLETGGPAVTLRNDILEATGALSSATIRRGQVHTFSLNVAIADGYHIQAAPLPEGYVPLELFFDEIEGVLPGSVTYPVAAPYRIAGLADQLHVYESTVSLQVPIRFRTRESITLTARLRFQACTAADCLPPDELTFNMPLTYLDNP